MAHTGHKEGTGKGLSTFLPIGRLQLVGKLRHAGRFHRRVGRAAVDDHLGATPHETFEVRACTVRVEVVAVEHQTPRFQQSRVTVEVEARGIHRPCGVRADGTRVRRCAGIPQEAVPHVRQVRNHRLVPAAEPAHTAAQQPTAPVRLDAAGIRAGRQRRPRAVDRPAIDLGQGTGLRGAQAAGAAAAALRAALQLLVVGRGGFALAEALHQPIGHAVQRITFVGEVFGDERQLRVAECLGRGRGRHPGRGARQFGHGPQAPHIGRPLVKHVQRGCARHHAVEVVITLGRHHGLTPAVRAAHEVRALGSAAEVLFQQRVADTLRVMHRLVCEVHIGLLVQRKAGAAAVVA